MKRKNTFVKSCCESFLMKEASYELAYIAKKKKPKKKQKPVSDEEEKKLLSCFQIFALFF